MGEAGAVNITVAAFCRSWRVSSVAVTDVEEIREQLSGAKFSQEPQASSVFALAVRSFTRWPVDAWAGVLDECGRLRTLYWIQGNTLGQMFAEGDEDSLTVSGTVQLISNIRAVRIAAQVSLDDYGAGRGRRAVTIEVSDGQGITLDVGNCTGRLRERANEFVDALLDAVSSRPVRADR